MRPTNADQREIYRKLRTGKNLCISCKFHEVETAEYFQGGHICNHEKNNVLDIITGELNLAVSCYGMRDVIGQCGPDGKLFEQINEKSHRNNL